jgi:ATP synthase protein I
MPPGNDGQRGELLRALTFFSQISVTIVACVAIGVFLGKFLDGFFGTSPWLLLVFSFLGMAAAFKSIFDVAQKK